MYKTDEYGHRQVSFDGGNEWSNITEEDANVYGFKPTNMLKDSSGRTYYQDRTGQVHYVEDTGLLWDGLMDYFTSFASWAGLGYDATKKAVGIGTYGGAAYSVEEEVFDMWWDNYVNGTGGWVGTDGKEH